MYLFLCGPYRTRTANPPCKGGVLANYTIQPNILKVFYLTYPVNSGRTPNRYCYPIHHR